MPKWSEVQSYMRKSYPLQDDTEKMFSMVWEYDDGRSQKVIVRRFTAYEQEMVEFKSAFAHRDDAEPEELLRKNAELPMGTIALSGDVYLVVYNVLLEALRLDDMALYLSRVSAVADTLEERYAQRDIF